MGLRTRITSRFWPLKEWKLRKSNQRSGLENCPRVIIRHFSAKCLCAPEEHFHASGWLPSPRRVNEIKWDGVDVARSGYWPDRISAQVVADCAFDHCLLVKCWVDESIVLKRCYSWFEGWSCYWGAFATHTWSFASLYHLAAKFIAERNQWIPKFGESSDKRTFFEKLSRGSQSYWEDIPTDLYYQDSQIRN